MVNDCPVSNIKSVSLLSEPAKRKCNLRSATDRFIGMLGQNESLEDRSEGRVAVSQEQCKVYPQLQAELTQCVCSLTPLLTQQTKPYLPSLYSHTVNSVPLLYGHRGVHFTVQTGWNCYFFNNIFSKRKT